MRDGRIFINLGGLQPRGPGTAEGGAKMPPLVNVNAAIMCAHGGKVMLIAKQTSVTAGGAPVLCEGDLVAAPIVGCAPPPSPGTKPCTMVVSTLPGGTSLKAMAGGRPVHVQTLSGLTDGVPPAPILVTSPGQTTVQG